MLAAFIFYASLFIALVVVPAGLILVALLFLEHERRLWQRVTGALGPVGRILVRVPFVAGFETRFPRTARCLARRLDPRDPWGLPATLAAVAIFLGLWFFLGVLQDIVAKDPLVILDIRLHNSVPLFRNAGMTRFMLVCTELGGAAALSLLCLGIALLALARGRQRLAATFILAPVGTSLLSVSLKAAIGNARPLDAIIAANEASFPSGHLLSATVVYGLLAALLLASRARFWLRALGVTLLLLLIVGVGLSRLYLGVHWPSDLLASLALALIILAASIFFLYYAHPVPWVDRFALPLSPRTLGIAGTSAVVMTLATAAVLASQTKMILVEPRLGSQILDIRELQSSLPEGMPRWTEDLVGSRMEPISLVFVGSERDVVEVFARAGWARADLPTPVRVLEEGIAALRSLPDPTGPATPAYFMDWPQSFTFEKPDAGSPNIRRRHHTRVWQTLYCVSPDCRRLWVGSASFDVGLELSKRLYLPTHRIDPEIDNERTLIVADLTEAGAARAGMVTAVPPLRGRNAAGDTFRTDGQAVVVVLPQR